jgi:hypothetical protein
VSANLVKVLNRVGEWHAGLIFLDNQLPQFS